MPDRPDHPNLPIVVGDGIATVTIDRPDARNSLTPEMIDALFAATLGSCMTGAILAIVGT